MIKCYTTSIVNAVRGIKHSVSAKQLNKLVQCSHVRVSDVE